MNKVQCSSCGESYPRTWKAHGRFLILFGVAISISALAIWGWVDAFLTSLMFSLPFIAFGIRFVSMKRPCPKCKTME